MDKIGGEIGNAFKRVTEAVDMVGQRRKEVDQFINANDTQGTINYFTQIL